MGGGWLSGSVLVGGAGVVYVQGVRGGNSSVQVQGVGRVYRVVNGQG